MRTNKLLFQPKKLDRFRIIGVTILLLAIFLTGSISPVQAFPTVEDYYIGINYPGLALGLNFNDSALELRYFTDGDIDLYGARLRHDLYHFEARDLSDNIIYLGADALFTEFEDTLTEGDGLMYGIVGGLETPISQSITANLDIGPYQVEIEDDYSGLDSSGLHYVLNFGINIFLW